MNNNFVTILGGKFLTNGKIVKTASPHTQNPHPIAQVVVGGHVGYHLLQKGKKVFYSLELIEELYKDNLPAPKKPKRKVWRYIAIAIIIGLVLSVTTCDVTVKTNVTTTEVEQ
jgi:hypothetical protein